MTRLVIALAAMLAILISTDGWFRWRQAEFQKRVSALRLLFDPQAEIVPERIQRIEVRAGQGRRVWVYEKVGKHWRYPAYHSAYVQLDRVDFLLQSLLQAHATTVAFDREEEEPYGVSAHQAVQIILADDTGSLGEVWVGRGAPGTQAREAYVRHGDDAVIFHLHANPMHALTAGDPPMVDPLLFPKALPRKSTLQVNFYTPQPSLRQLQRVDKSFPTGSPLIPRPGQYNYDWVATSENRRDTCLVTNVFAYTGFLKNLRFQTLHDPRANIYGFSDDNRIELVDEDGTVDILHIGRREGESVFVHNVSAGLVCSVNRRSADLLFPTYSVLTDTLADPSPYSLVLQ